MVYCGLYPSDGQDFSELRVALTKLSINDPSFEFEPESSDALGFGFRCGFLGLLHMEIIQQRLEGEADIDLVQTAPNVTYQIMTKMGEILEIHRPQEVPDSGQIAEFRQPIVRVNIVIPEEYVGAVMKLCTERRGVQTGQEYLSPTRVMLTYELPLGDVIYDMHDKMKSNTRGVIARETVKALRKNVTAKCYGGDISRKRKLWQKQKEGKKRMKSIGSVDIPQKAFMAVLDTGEAGK